MHKVGYSMPLARSGKSPRRAGGGFINPVREKETMDGGRTTRCAAVRSARYAQNPIPASAPPLLFNTPHWQLSLTYITLPYDHGA